MFCGKCGNIIPDNAKFCAFCGFQMTESDATTESFSFTANEHQTEAININENGFNDSVYVQPESVTTDVPKKSKKKLIIILASVAVGIIAIAACVIFLLMNDIINLAPDKGKTDNDSKKEQSVEVDDKKLSKLIDKALELIKSGSYAEAFDILDETEPDDDLASFKKYERIKNIASFACGKVSVDTSDFPYIDVSIDRENDISAVLSESTDNGTSLTPISSENSKKGVTEYRFLCEDYTANPEDRTLTLSYTVDDMEIEFSVVYTSPSLPEATIELVSTDITDYPNVKTYFRICDPDGTVIEDINKETIVIREKISGGEYVYREVSKAELLGESEGLAISLVADKSSSIEPNDMTKIRSVMTEFVDTLNLEGGDIAEVLAFDDIVQQMCAFTDDPSRLKNGIMNMYTDGRTALYDALHDGIYHSYLRGGARCVVAFTDGIDNESHYTSNEIITYSKQKQVPVYIIGVGTEVEEYTLRDIAESTGGKYWFIDNLNDLREIYIEIYNELIKLYCVSYISDGTADPISSRSLELLLKQLPIYGKCSVDFTPVKGAEQKTHTSKYEIFKENLTWEQAYEKCEQLGGHLATVTSKDEEKLIIDMAEKAGVDYIWLGGYTSYNTAGDVFGHWITGEEFTYAGWYENQPSRKDIDGTPEWYIMLWNIPHLGGWSWNDQRNDPVSAVKSMESGMGFVCEYED